MTRYPAPSLLELASQGGAACPQAAEVRQILPQQLEDKLLHLSCDPGSFILSIRFILSPPVRSQVLNFCPSEFFLDRMNRRYRMTPHPAPSVLQLASQGGAACPQAADLRGTRPQQLEDKPLHLSCDPGSFILSIRFILSPPARVLFGQDEQEVQDDSLPRSIGARARFAGGAGGIKAAPPAAAAGPGGSAGRARDWRNPSKRPVWSCPAAAAVARPPAPPRRTPPRAQ